MICPRVTHVAAQEVTGDGSGRGGGKGRMGHGGDVTTCPVLTFGASGHRKPGRGKVILHLEGGGYSSMVAAYFFPRLQG